MTVFSLPVSFNGELFFSSRGDYLIEGFGAEIGWVRDAFGGGRFTVLPDGSVRPDWSPGLPVVRVQFDLFFSSNFTVVDRNVRRTEVPKNKVFVDDLRLHLEDDARQEVIVTKTENRLVFWLNHLASVQQ